MLEEMGVGIYIYIGKNKVWDAGYEAVCNDGWGGDVTVRVMDRVNVCAWCIQIHHLVYPPLHGVSPPHTP